MGGRRRLGRVWGGGWEMRVGASRIAYLLPVVVLWSLIDLGVWW